MTRKDYELIARAIDKARAGIIKATRHDYAERSAQLEGARVATRGLAFSLEATNPRFDVGKFLAAAVDGPEFRKASNDEALARNVGPGSTKG